MLAMQPGTFIYFPLWALSPPRFSSHWILTVNDKSNKDTHSQGKKKISAVTWKVISLPLPKVWNFFSVFEILISALLWDVMRKYTKKYFVLCWHPQGFPNSISHHCTSTCLLRSFLLKLKPPYHSEGTVSYSWFFLYFLYATNPQDCSISLLDALLPFS